MSHISRTLINHADPLGAAIIHGPDNPLTTAGGMNAANGTLVTTSGGLAFVKYGAGATEWRELAGTFISVRAFGAKGDGVADDSAAIQAAIEAVKAAGGGVVFFPTGQYRVTASLNVTNAGVASTYSIIFRGSGQRTTQINAQCTGKALFDCTGASFFVFEDMAINGNGSQVPTTAILAARTTTLNSAGNHLIRNVLLYGSFSKASIYNYASEEMTITDGCTINNNVVGAKCVAYTKTNILALTSNYATIATTAISTTVQRITDSAITHYATSGASDCIYVDGMGALTMDRVFMLTSGARAFVYIDASVSTSTNIALRDCAWDGDATLYGVTVAGANAVAEIVIDHLYDVGVKPFAGTVATPTGGIVVYGQDGSVVSNVSIRNVFSNNSFYRFDEIDYSDLDFRITDTIYVKNGFNGNTIKAKSTNLTLNRPDFAGGSVAYFRDTGSWANLRESLNVGDANKTLLASDHPTQRWDSGLSANRTCTLPANAASARGQTFRVVRTGLGAFTLTVQDATPTVLKVIASATAAFVDVEFINGAWKLAGYGAL